MSEPRNGWTTWYAQLDEVTASQDSDIELNIIPYTDLASWGDAFCEYVTLNDHWIGYLHPEPMSQEDGMSIAFVLYDAGVNVEELLDVLSTFQPLMDTPMPVEVNIPLCWLTEPMDHVQDLLGMLANVSHIDPDILDQIQQMMEETIGEVPVSPDELPDLFRAMTVSTVQWLLEIIRILGEQGMLALRAWWQGRLISLLREATPPRRRRGRRRQQRTGPEVPSAFRDLFQSLDLRATDEDDEADS
jgi:hypothetical protein